ncbi:MAG: hypothetical protein NTZ39_10035 [Methanoregula sp.]|nr:hypothetical protein [Methanoregula sp.]
MCSYFFHGKPNAEIDEEVIEDYHGTTQLPIQPGTYKRIAVKIVDDQGIKKHKIMEPGE